MTMSNEAGQRHARIIATVPKNSKEAVALAVSLFKGHLLLDIRAWIDTDNGPRPTRKGVSLNVRRIPELIAALRKVQAELDKAEAGE